MSQDVTVEVTVRDWQKLETEYEEALKKVTIEKVADSRTGDHSYSDWTNYYEMRFGDQVVSYNDGGPNGTLYDLDIVKVDALRRLGVLSSDFPNFVYSEAKGFGFSSGINRISDLFRLLDVIKQFKTEYPEAKIDDVSFGIPDDKSAIDVFNEYYVKYASQQNDIDSIIDFIEKQAGPQSLGVIEKIVGELKSLIKDGYNIKNMDVEAYFQNHEVIDSYQNIKDMNKEQALNYLYDKYRNGKMLIINLEKDGLVEPYEFGRITAAHHCHFNWPLPEYHSGLDWQLNTAERIHNRIRDFEASADKHYKISLDLFPELKDHPSAVYNVKNQISNLDLYDCSDFRDLCKKMMSFAKDIAKGKWSWGHDEGFDITEYHYDRSSNLTMWHTDKLYHPNGDGFVRDFKHEMLECGKSRQQDILEQLAIYSEWIDNKAESVSVYQSAHHVAQMINILDNASSVLPLEPAEKIDAWTRAVMELGRIGFDLDAHKMYELAKTGGCLDNSNPFSADLLRVAIQDKDREGMRSLLTKGRDDDVKDKYIDLILDAAEKSESPIRLEGLSRGNLINYIGVIEHSSMSREDKDDLMSKSMKLILEDGYNPCQLSYEIKAMYEPDYDFNRLREATDFAISKGCEPGTNYHRLFSKWTEQDEDLDIDEEELDEE